MPVPSANMPKWPRRDHERRQPFNRVGARVHDVTHPHWQQDMEILVGHRRQPPALHHPAQTAQRRRRAGQIEACAKSSAKIWHRPQDSGPCADRNPRRLREVWEIAALPGVESLDFGLMDFVSGHHGAIPGSAMKSPGQFDHPLVARAKCEITAAALANGVVPSHNVTTELKDIDYIRNDARRARTEFGYLRMWSIHPNQIVPIVEAMRPDFSEVQAASKS
jgi:citrate lyase subunit beta/citryl-CoA lyase